MWCKRPCARRRSGPPRCAPLTDRPSCRRCTPPAPGRRAREAARAPADDPVYGRLVDRKLIVFVPREALDPVREALFAAGAGRIGDYEHCSWYTAGTGTFHGGESTDPSVGEKGREQRVSE